MNAASDDVSTALEEFDGALPETVDEAAIGRMRLVAHVLDEGVRVPGTSFRFGLDPIVGAIPGAGDTVMAAVSLYVVAESARMGVSRSTLLRMLANVAVDTLGGSIPVLGVAFDAFWKANKWNLKLALQDLVEGTDRADTEPKTVSID
jgi:hypothetical protein